jgi:hypothetical protein
MPNAKDNAKMTGDTHPPDVESDLPAEEGSTDEAGTKGVPRNRGKASERGAQGRPGRGIKKAGLLKEEEERTSDRDGNTPDSDEGSDRDRG